MVDMVEIRFLDSQGVLEEFSDCIRGSKRVKIAVAYFTQEGLDSISPSLKKLLRSHKRVDIVVGVSSYYGITDWKVLNELLQLRKNYPSLHLRYYDDPGFHPKLFIFEMQEGMKIVIGSSNLTGGGLRKNAEANISLATGPDEDIAQKVDEKFKFWFNGANRLTPEIVDTYKRSIEGFRKARGLAARKRIRLRAPLPKRETIRKPVIPSAKRRSFWKVAPGSDGYQWPRWESEIEGDIGIIAVGWTDFTKLNLADEEKARRQLKSELEKRTKIGYVLNQARMFCKEMKVGHIVVAYSKKYIFGIGQIVGKPYYKEVRDWNPFPNRRNAKWLWLEGQLVPTKRYMNVLGRPRDTIHRITDKNTIAFVTKLLRGRK